MRKITLAAIFLLVACAPTPNSQTVAALPPEAATAAAAKQVPPAGAAMLARDLKALDYNTGKSDDPADPAFARAIAGFERDQGLSEDGLISPLLLDRLSALRALLLKTPDKRDALFVYSDGATRQQGLGLLPPPPKSLASDAPANFLLPLRPGSDASYHIGPRGKAGAITPAITVTCHVGRLAPTNAPLGTRQIMPLDCAGRGGAAGATPQSWRALFSPELNAVTRLEIGTKVVDLVALRPATAAWPAAARTGLEWALTHQLNSPASAASAEWSSSGVAARVEIRTTSPLSGQQAGLSGKYAALSCRRFEMTQSAVRFPGIACRDKAGWFLPGSNAHLSSPASALAGGKLVMGEKER